MRLAEVVSQEAGVGVERVMLLRHSSKRISMLRTYGGSVEEYTFIQPTGSKYDYSEPQDLLIEVVVVIVDENVYRVYRVLGIEAIGTSYSLASEAHRRFNIEKGSRERPSKRFRMEPIQSITINHSVSGWERRHRTTVQRSNGKFFGEVEIVLPAFPRSDHELWEELSEGVRSSLNDTAAIRQQRLASAPRFPTRVEVRTQAFIRNPDVIADVLCRAAGVCEDCQMPAPFIRRSDGTPYLEVHHRVPLASGGEDTVDNAITLCPNCHRRIHYA
jgi:hypothetical protein